MPTAGPETPHSSFLIPNSKITARKDGNFYLIKEIQ